MCIRDRFMNANFYGQTGNKINLVALNSQNISLPVTRAHSYMGTSSAPITFSHSCPKRLSLESQKNFDVRHSQYYWSFKDHPSRNFMSQTTVCSVLCLVVKVNEWIAVKPGLTLANSLSSEKLYCSDSSIFSGLNVLCALVKHFRPSKTYYCTHMHPTENFRVKSRWWEIRKLIILNTIIKLILDEIFILL